MKFLLDRKSLETIYLTFIRPVFVYAYVVLGNCTNEKEEFDKKNRQMQLGLSRGLLNLCHYMHFTRK